MKFITTVKALKSAVDTISKCIASKPLMPVLAGIKLDYNNDLVLTAFNLAEGMQVICDCEDGESGSIVILEKDLSSLLSKISGTIEVESIGTTVKISTEYSKIELQGLDVSEYPDDIFDVAKSNAIDCELPTKSLTESIARCNVSTSGDETKQLLQGINFQADNGMLKLASTDGHRLTICSIPCDVEIPSNTIPGKFLTKLPKTLAESISLSIDSTSAMFSDASENVSICRLFEGKYPDYNLLIPKSFTRKLTVDRAQLIELLSVAEIACSATNLVELKLKSTDLSIHSSRDAAKAISTMPCQLSGNVINIGFNLKYLIQGLKIFDDEMITLNFNGAIEPVTIVSLDEMTTHLMMPIQIAK